jgi:biotin carboxylase
MGRVLLLLPTTTYRSGAYLRAAAKLGFEIVVASERPSTLASTNPGGLLTLDLLDPEKPADEAARFAAQYPIQAVAPVDEDTAVIAAHIAERLGLRHNPIFAAERARNKWLMREALKQAGLAVPGYWRFTLDDDLELMAATVRYPCVVKPVSLSTSRGVMRADNRAEFISAVHRLERILVLPSVKRRAGASAREVLAEEFIPGVEVALEGLLTEGALKVLAIFDKPDPLNGPFFEETIYVTPSRLLRGIQAEIAGATEAAAKALGLLGGPVHAELRINENGPWIVEVAARAIGGLCSRSLRFDGGASLEEIILMHSMGLDVTAVQREKRASGVMMIPVPRAGILKEVNGLADALSVDLVDDVVISAHLTQEIHPPPEGASYLGFIFSHADTPAQAESALRQAHAKLEFVIEDKL